MLESLIEEVVAMAEIEVKYPLEDRDIPRLQERLRAIGARCEGVVFERNVTFDDERGTLAAQDQLLRLRQTSTVRLTFKGKREPGAKFKIREELEVEVSDYATMAAILARLGFAPKRRYEKERETWHWRDAEVFIDHLPFGWFTEIEGPPATIEALEQAVGLDPARRSTKDYYQLYDDFCRARGLPAGDIVFGP